MPHNKEESRSTSLSEWRQSEENILCPGMAAAAPRLRITTWNVNGIRNPFGYPPWRDRRTFDAMFDILEADVVVMQELKIQRKDLRDDMVLVPGWDCYFSLPRRKKGRVLFGCHDPKLLFCSLELNNHM